MTGHLRKRGKKKNQWSIVIELGRDPKTDKRRQKWHSFEGTKTAAEAEKTRILHELQTGIYILSHKVTVAALLDRYVNRLKNAIGEDGGASWYENCEQFARLHLKPRLGSIPLKDLSAIHIEDCLDELRKSGNKRTGGGLAPRSIHLIQAFLHAALEQAVRWDLILRNPAARVEWPNLPKAKVNVLTLEQTRVLLDAARGSALYVPILLGVTCGMRRGECLALKWGHVDLDAGVLIVRQSLEQAMGTLTVKPPKSESGVRPITLPAAVVTAFRRHKAEQALERLQLGPAWQNIDLVCCQADGSYWSPQAITLRFRRLVAKLEIPRIRFHDLRHTHATHLLEANVQAKVVSERLGHSKIARTLDTYSHVMPSLQEDAARRVDTAFREAIGDL